MGSEDLVMVGRFNVVILLILYFRYYHIVARLKRVESHCWTLQSGNLGSEVSFARKLLLNFRFGEVTLSHYVAARPCANQVTVRAFVRLFYSLLQRIDGRWRQNAHLYK